MSYRILFAGIIFTGFSLHSHEGICGFSAEPKNRKTDLSPANTALIVVDADGAVRASQTQYYPAFADTPRTNANFKARPADEKNLQLIKTKADTLLQAYSRQNNFNGTALLAFRGEIVLLKGYGWRNTAKHIPNDENSIYKAASITKTFTATLVMKLAEMKKLSLQDKLSRYYPGYPQGDSITIAQLLSHTSGIYDYTRDGDFMQNRSTKPATEAEMLALFENAPFDFTPGAGWSYSNSGYMLLGYIIRKVMGITYEEAVRRYIFTPLGMRHSGFDFARLNDEKKTTAYAADSLGEWSIPMPDTDSTVSFAAGAMYTTAADLFRWHEGLSKYAVVRPESWRELSIRKRNNYSYGWIIDTIQGKYTIGHSGGMRGFRTNFIRLPEDDACIILLSNSETMALGTITEKLVAILYGKPYDLPMVKTAVKVDTSILRKYTGTYFLAEKDLRIHIVLENGVLVAYPEKGPRSVLCATSLSCFFLKEDTDFETCFITDTTGKGVRLTIRKGDREGTAQRLEE